MRHHIATGPLTIEFRPVPNLSLPIARFAAAFANLCIAAGHIFELTYVQPYRARPFSGVPKDESHEDRDPSW